MEPSSPVRTDDPDEPDDERQPSAPPGPDGSEARAARRARWSAHLFALLVGVVGLLCALALPFAPVWADQTEVRWPSAEEPVASTTALFAPYRPAEFTATIPCPALRAALERPEPTTVLSTLPPGSDREGLVLRTAAAEPVLLLGQREVRLPPLPAAGCDLAVHADGGSSSVSVGALPPIRLPGVAAPEIFTFRTDLPPEQAGQLAVTARTYSWFDTSPTPLKRTLAFTAAVLGATSLLLLIAHAPPARAAVRRAVLDRIRFNALLILLIDLVVGGALALWLFIGPLSDDDGFAMMTVRNYAQTGDIGNFYRWFNSSETPFTLVQHLMRWVSGYSLAPPWLRAPSMIAGFLTWLLLSHGIVARLCRGTRRAPLHLLSAVFFLACWLPYDLGIRPESFIALGTAGIFAALLRATGEDTGSPFGWLGLAALLTGLTVAITPTGVAAVLIVAVFAPRIGRLLVRRGTMSRWLAVPARIALLGCLGGGGLVAMFADSTWNGVLHATEVHNEFGPSLGWYQEIERYYTLLAPNEWGSAGKRLGVLLTITALLVAGACAMRGLHRITRIPELPLLLGGVLAVFAALWFTPSKWSHHFGALAGLGPALIATTAVLLVRTGAVESARREARMVGSFGGAAAAIAAALAFSAPNAWWQYSDFGVAWSDTPVRPLGLPLDSPLSWLALAAAAGLLAWLLVRLRVLRSAVALPATAVWTTSALIMTGVLIGSFLQAPARAGEFSVGGSNLDSGRARSCGIENDVETLPLAEGGTLGIPDGPIDDTGGTSSDESAAGTGRPGFTANEGRPSRPPQEPLLRAEPGEQALRPTGPEAEPIDASPLMWDSLRDGTQTVGEVNTGWFELPRPRPDQVLSVWVAGRPEQGNELRMDFGNSLGEGVRPLGTRELRDAPPQQLPFEDPRMGRPVDWRSFSDWRLITVNASELPPGTDRVRLHAADTTTDEQGWLAFGGPVVRDVVPLRQILDGGTPALVDWPISFLFPCHVDYPRVGRGTADSPGVLVTPPGGESSMAFEHSYGGVFAGALNQSRRLETPSRLRGAPGLTWGHVFSMHYDAGRDVYDRTTRRVRQGGADGDGAYPFEPGNLHP